MSKRILFCGGKNIGFQCLSFMTEAGYDIIDIVPNPSDITDKRTFPSVTELGWKKKIPVLPSNHLDSVKNIESIKKLEPDLIVVVYFDRILKPALINIPPLGCINLHMALAEEYRGCFPTTWAILNGEQRTGVTLHYIDTEVDSGDIIAQLEVPITDTTTGKSLYDDCTVAGVKLFKEYFPLIEQGTVPRREQIVTDKTKSYPRVFPSQEIDFSQSGEEILRHIKAHIFPPYPPAYFYIGEQKYYIVSEDKD